MIDRNMIKDDFPALIGAQAKRKLRAQRDPGRDLWFGLGMMGLVGWSVCIPTLAGTALGLWLDKYHPAGHAWTLALLVAGLCLGCANAWHWVSKAQESVQEGPTDDPE